MEKKILIPIIIAVVIILGFVVAAFLPEMTPCTKLGCPCENLVSERPCNSCTVSDPIFTICIINIAKVCPAQEIILCENNLDIGRRIDIDDDKCGYKLSFIVY